MVRGEFTAMLIRNEFKQQRNAERTLQVLLQLLP
jgi:hypothetical protein